MVGWCLVGFGSCEGCGEIVEDFFCLVGYCFRYFLFVVGFGFGWFVVCLVVVELNKREVGNLLLVVFGSCFVFDGVR